LKPKQKLVELPVRGMKLREEKSIMHINNLSCRHVEHEFITHRNQQLIKNPDIEWLAHSSAVQYHWTNINPWSTGSVQHTQKAQQFGIGQYMTTIHLKFP